MYFSFIWLAKDCTGFFSTLIAFHSHPLPLLLHFLLLIFSLRCPCFGEWWWDAFCYPHLQTRNHCLSCRCLNQSHCLHPAPPVPSPANHTHNMQTNMGLTCQLYLPSNQPSVGHYGEKFRIILSQRVYMYYDRKKYLAEIKTVHSPIHHDLLVP